MRILLLLPVVMVITADSAVAQAVLPQWKPTAAEMADRYAQAKQMDSAVKNTVFKAEVRANWLPGGTAFWYRNALPQNGQEYVYIDVAKAEKKQIAKEEATALPKDTAVTGRAGRGRGRWRDRGISPDSQWNAYIQEGNVYLKKRINGSEAIALTKDGTVQKPYGSLSWSPDSRHVIGYLVTPVKDSSVYYIATSLPATTRGQLRSQEYKQPGDPFTSYEMFLFAVAERKQVKVNTALIDFGYPPELHWRENRYFLFQRSARGHQRFLIMEGDVQTAQTRNVLEERTNTFIYEQRIVTEYINHNTEMIWVSEKDGWRRMYLVNVITGAIKPINQGQWVVRDIDSVDENKKEIWFRASGMNPGEDPYFIHYYRIGFDGRHLVSLTPAEGNHQVVFSPDKKYYLDTWSQVNIPPITALHRTSDGKDIMEVERADITALVATGVRLPEAFHAKGRDGTTDIWGVVCKPSHFDSSKKYPVIENIYAGPQDSFVPKNFLSYSEMQSIAELGFIVVQIDGMGTANRSKAFHDVCWHNLADAGFADRILWIKALAAKYAYVDATRVGLYGTSAGGQNALGGLLFHPEFYKAAVAACGCHDNRVDKQWWNEQWMGYPVGPHYEQQSNVTNAGKLKGSLLLIVGEEDTNVPPESTYRVADALIRANKSFDFLPVPGMGHSDGGPYGKAKKKDFFVKRLLGVDAPDRN